MNSPLLACIKLLSASVLLSVSSHLSATDTLPVAVDNSTSDYFPPVINQIGGSCAQASGIGYMFTYEMNRLLKRSAKDSDEHRYSYLFVWNLLNDGVDTGGFVDEGLNLTRLYGVMSEHDYGKSSWTSYRWASGYDKYFRALHNRTEHFYSFNCETDADVQRIKQYLYNKGVEGAAGGILTFSTYSSDWRIDTSYQGPSETGYHALLTRLATEGSHALTIAGYDDRVVSTDASGRQREGAFIVVNSWGEGWGDHGRFYLPYHLFTDRDKRIGDSYLSGSMTGVDVMQHSPKVVFRIRLKYSSRDDLAFVMGAAGQYTATTPSERHDDYVFHHKGGDHRMKGAQSSFDDFEFALDYTNHLPLRNGERQPLPKYFLNILRNNKGKKLGEGTVEELSVIDYTHTESPREYFCRQCDGQSLRQGSNWFAIPARYWGRYSASPVPWRDEEGMPLTRTFVLRTAHGRYAKLRFTGYDNDTQRVTFDYAIQNNGSRSFQ